MITSKSGSAAYTAEWDELESDETSSDETNNDDPKDEDYRESSEESNNDGSEDEDYRESSGEAPYYKRKLSDDTEDTDDEDEQPAPKQRRVTKEKKPAPSYPLIPRNHVMPVREKCSKRKLKGVLVSPVDY